MNVFWRTNPLSLEEVSLLDALSVAHKHSSFRSNPSSIVVGCTAQGCGDICRSIAAALMTLGGNHGPIEDTYALLAMENIAASHLIQTIMDRRMKVPGWGSSFGKDEVDSEWTPVQKTIQETFPSIARRLDAFTEELHSRGIMIYPNPSAFTAASAIALGMPKRLAPYLLIIGRIESWAEIFLNETKGT